jgi:ankyrin repeat protein/predicted Ser/Thr protein kinase
VPRWSAPLPEEIASDFPHLEILAVLGQGGMGVVYKARQKSLDRLVALKILAVPSDAGPGFAERFAREARALASLSHPSIVTVYDFGQAGGRYFLLMEYVDGANLHQLIRDGEIDPRQALRLVSQICDALQFAHDAGVVHRDIKPENILVDRKGRVKIADFGLAKILGQTGDQSRLTDAQQVMGTAHYMAPEQIEKPLEVDHRADIYSLGVVFYELLTGELPIGRFQPPSRKIEVDVRVDEVVLKTLSKEPQLRYQNASEIKTDVEGIAASPAKKETPVKIYGAAINLHWTIWVALAVFVLVFGALWFLIRSEEGETRSLATEAAVGVGFSSDAPGTPLAQAAATGHREGVEALLDNGLDVNAPGPGNTTALIEAVDGEHADLVRLLLERGADVNAANSRGVTAIMIAASQGNEEIVSALLDRAAEVNAVGPGGTTALIEAIDGGHNGILELLVARGANVNASNDRGHFPLHLAAASGRAWIARLLVEFGANIDAPGPRGDTALILAVQEGHEDVVRTLLEAGADPQARGADGRTPLEVAAAEGRTELLELFRKPSGQQSEQSEPR